MLRGYLFVGAIGLFLLIGDIVERIVLVPLTWLFPSRRDRLMTRWMYILRRTGFFIFRRVGGARFDGIPELPCQPGVLILMNHQSLLDIPVLFMSVTDGYPLFVARERYAHGIPTVSHNIRFYGHPRVNPVRFSPRQLDALSDLAASAPRPVAIFPEGTRTKTGDIGRFRTAGVKAILAPRQWAVYLVVGDGLWQSAGLGDLVREVRNIRARFSTTGPFQSPGPDATEEDTEAFIETMRTRMVEQLQALRDDAGTGQ
jgi:1-acyl-sn-glycerol-3-phosphate acyltransferase